MTGGTISRQPGVVEAQFDDIRVVLNEDLAYLGLDEVGQRVWDLLEEPRSLDGVVGALLEEYDVDRATCERDVAAFVAALEQHKLVTRG
ncbi:PqqD family peptide modification chaperone [Nocardioides panacisoli]|uniref:PqqD family protein n=1 Tax=Nocardioides panacisoli TaxID=627624 RepID=A0ABP7IVS0_9ACTN